MVRITCAHLSFMCTVRCRMADESYNKQNKQLRIYSRIIPGTIALLNEDFFCREVSPLISAYILDALYSAGVFDDLDDFYAFGIDDFYEQFFSPKSTYESCMDIMQCPSTYAVEDGYLFQNTPSMCCGDQYRRWTLPFGQPMDIAAV